MRILITGGTGFVARHLLQYWQNSHHELTVLARSINPDLFAERIGCLEIDITVKEDVQAAIIFAKPDIIIHTAALSKPNDCELNKELCYTTNILATGYIAEASRAIGARLIFLSTDFVFSNNGPYSEADEYEPVNYYGQSKMEAEKLIIASHISYAIVRTVLVIGKKLEGQANTFLHWVKENVEQGKTIKVYTDQMRNATYVNDLCTGINAIVDKGFEGIVHLGGEEIFTPYSLAKQVAEYHNYPDNLIEPVTSLQRPEAAARPQNAVLKIGKAKARLNYLPTPLQKALAEIFSDRE